MRCLPSAYSNEQGAASLLTQNASHSYNMKNRIGKEHKIHLLVDSVSASTYQIAVYKTTSFTWADVERL